MEDPIAFVSLSKISTSPNSPLASFKNQNLLLKESLHVFALSSKHIHYIELKDVKIIPFPAEVKNGIHSFVKHNIKEMVKKGSAIHHHHEGDAPTEDSEGAERHKEKEADPSGAARTPTLPKKDSTGDVRKRSSFFSFWGAG